MGSLSVVVAPPCFDGFAGVGEAAEEVLIETFISQSVIEALDKAILHGLACLNVMPLNTALLLPLKDGARRQLRAVVADHHARVAATLGDAVEFARGAPA